MPGAGRYHISRKIADGGMAEIFLGSQRGVEGFERPVVLKRILASLLADPQFRNQMIDEAHVAMSLNHSNIVQVLDLGHAAGRYFLVLELVDGWDLNQIVNRCRAASFPLPPELSLYIGAEVCRALGYAHAKTRDGQPLGIVHRDVSPHNVLISEQGEVKLTDFGIAKALGRREHTGHGVIKGKLAFMSPEQASGHVVDGRSDLFSLGTVLYVLATGTRPFESPTDLEVIVRVRQCNFVPPTEIVPDLSPEFVRIIMRAMQALPSDRYQSAEEMLIDIETVQRSFLKPAGQTELKRWLAELQQKDDAPTILRAAQQVPVGDGDVLQLDDSAELIFDDSSQIGPPPERPVPRPTQPTVADASPAFLPTVHVEPPPPIPAARRRRKSFSHRLLLVVSLGGPAVLLGWLGLSGLRETRPPAHRMTGSRTSNTRVVAVRPSTLTPPAPTPPVPVAPPPAPLPALPASGERVVAAEKATAQSPAAGRKDTPPAPNIATEETRVQAQASQTEDEEEALLRHSEPADSDQVLGEAEGEGPALQPAGKRAKAEPALPESVSVHIDSRPTGAVVKLKDRVFGRSPLNLRFRPGIKYELTFVKKGYQSTSKRFTVSGRKNQTIAVNLEKKHTPRKRSLFRRLFGRR